MKTETETAAQRERERERGTHLAEIEDVLARDGRQGQVLGCGRAWVEGGLVLGRERERERERET